MKRILVIVLSLMMVVSMSGCASLLNFVADFDEDEREESFDDGDERYDDDDDDRHNDEDDEEDNQESTGNNSGTTDDIGAVDADWQATQDALLDYINNGVVALGVLETEMLTSYNSVTGANYVSDAVTYTEFTTKTLVVAQQLDNKAVEIAATLTDETVIELHKIYMDYSTKFRNVIIIMISAIEDQDVEQVAQANEILNEANQLATTYASTLRALAEEYDIEILTE